MVVKEKIILLEELGEQNPLLNLNLVNQNLKHLQDFFMTEGDLVIKGQSDLDYFKKICLIKDSSKIKTDFVERTLSDSSRVSDTESKYFLKLNFKGDFYSDLSEGTFAKEHNIKLYYKPNFLEYLLFDGDVISTISNSKIFTKSPLDIADFNDNFANCFKGDKVKKQYFEDCIQQYRGY